MRVRALWHAYRPTDMRVRTNVAWAGNGRVVSSDHRWNARAFIEAAPSGAAGLENEGQSVGSRISRRI